MYISHTGYTNVGQPSGTTRIYMNMELPMSATDPTEDHTYDIVSNVNPDADHKTSVKHSEIALSTNVAYGKVEM